MITFKTIALAAGSLALAAPLTMPGTTASAADINTAGATGAYHSTFCPRLERRLSSSRESYRCKTSAGTRDNIERVYLNPRSIAYGQLDVIALETSDLDRSPFTVLRRDDAMECVFAVTRSRDISSFGDIAGYASRTKFFLPPRGSGSAGTYQYLQEIDPDGLGLARDVTYANSTDDAIIQALNSRDGVAFFVQFPDPSNARFKLIKQMGGQIVPVIDRKILRQEVNGKKIYTAQETAVDNASWAAAGSKVMTACTPIVIFTGRTDRISNEDDRRAHRDMVETVTSIRKSALLPKQGFLARIMARTRTMTSKARERVLSMSENAREKARPFMERAKQRALDASAAAARGAERMRDKALPR